MSTVEIKVPDIGDFKDVPIIEVFVKPGDAVKPEGPLIALESDKATMDVPSPAAGTVKDLKVKVGDRVSTGKVILVLDAAAGDGKGAAPSSGNGQSAASAQAAAPAKASPPAEAASPAQARERAAETQKTPEEERPAPGEQVRPAPAQREEAAARPPAAPLESEAFKKAHASPSVRKFARELGVDLSRVTRSEEHTSELQSRQ